MILVALIMLNMLLAIVMDAYTNAKGQISSSETLCEQAYELYRRWSQKRAGLRVSLNHIQRCYTVKLGVNIQEFLRNPDSRSEQILFVKDFQSDVVGLGAAQAKRLLTNAVHDFKNDLEAENPLGLTQAMGVISKIHQKLDCHISEWKRSQQEAVERKVLQGRQARPKTIATCS